MKQHGVITYAARLLTQAGPDYGVELSSNYTAATPDRHALTMHRMYSVRNSGGSSGAHTICRALLPRLRVLDESDSALTFCLPSSPRINTHTPFPMTADSVIRRSAPPGVREGWARQREATAASQVYTTK